MHSSCRHYRAVNASSGHCAADVYGPGTVSVGTCLLACPVYDGSDHLRRAYRARMAMTVEGIDPDTGMPQGVELVRWLGIMWIGTPLPLRLRLQAAWPPVVVAKSPGCGCIMKLKQAAYRLSKRRKRKGCGCHSSA